MLLSKLFNTLACFFCGYLIFLGPLFSKVQFTRHTLLKNYLFQHCLQIQLHRIAQNTFCVLCFEQCFLHAISNFIFLCGSSFYYHNYIIVVLGYLVTKILSLYNISIHPLHHPLFPPLPHSWNSFDKSHFSISYMRHNI
jgi:hypothetical protein